MAGLTGNLYLRARYLDPGLGRFLSADTVQPNAPGSQGYNLYAYTANNPVTWTDPTGHSVGGTGSGSGSSRTFESPTLLENWLEIGLALADRLVADCAARSPGGVCIGISASLIRTFTVIGCVLEIGGACWGTRGADSGPGGTSVNDAPSIQNPFGDCENLVPAFPWGLQYVAFEENLREARRHGHSSYLWSRAISGDPVALLLVAPDLIWLVGQFLPGAEWDYADKYGNYFRDFGNFHFGLIAAAMGIPPQIAACGPGFIQIMQRIADEWLGRGPRPVGLACGDPWEDTKPILSGCAYYYLCFGRIPEIPHYDPSVSRA